MALKSDMTCCFMGMKKMLIKRVFLLRQTQKHKIEVVKKEYKERSAIAKQLGITPNKL